MASVFKRMLNLADRKANKALDHLEDPSEQLDFAYQKQQDLLRKVRSNMVEVTTARKRLENEVKARVEEMARMTNAAQAALTQGREDLAREALERKESIAAQMRAYEVQYNQLREQEDKLKAQVTLLEKKISEFRNQKEVIKAQVQAAQVSARVQDSLTGLGDDLTGMQASIDKAQDKAQQLTARSQAVEELSAEGALGDTLGSSNLEAQLESLASTSQVELELSQLKQQLALEQGPGDHSKAQDTHEAVVLDKPTEA